MRKLVVVLIAVELLLSLVACQGGLPMPTATAIPLDATATPSPRPTRPTATKAPADVQPTKVEVTESAPTPVPVPSTPAVTEGRSLSELDDRLAERTAEGFLQRLASDEAESAAKLYLSDSARQGTAAELLAQFSAGSPAVLEAALLELRRATASSYEARALLRLVEADGGDVATQTMTLRLVYQRGLWWVDDITLGD